jgi:ubiquinol-cytochrome c reductase cytochrome c1 subunit
MKTMIKFLTGMMLASMCWAGAAFAASEAKLDVAQIEPNNTASLQAGAKTFVNYCLNCHSASMVRYNQLKGIGLNDKQIEENLLFTGTKVGDMMKVAASPADQKAWFGVVPPDLSVIARARGADWLYTYFNSFYRDPSTATGWNNTLFPNVGMPHVLWTLQGSRDAKVEMKDDGHGHQMKQITLSDAKGGSQSKLDYDKTVVDLVNFMVWMGEPHAHARKQMGYYVLMALGVLMLVAYLLKAAFWKDVH